MLRHQRTNMHKIFLRIIMVSLGAIIMALGLELFLVPNHIMDGGIVGVSIITSHLLNLPLGIFIFILNLPFIFLGYKQIGKTFALSTGLGITVLSLATLVLHNIHPFTEDTLLATVFGGMILGVGVGIVIRYGGSLDGTEILAILFNSKTPFSVGEIIMFFNVLIFTVAGFVFNWEQAMYSIIAYYIAYKMIDIVIQGLEESKSVYIISDDIDEIGQTIMDRLGRGVTFLHGEGAYTGNDKKVIFTVITRLEESKLKSIVAEIDDNAFLAIGNIAEVKGGRFKKKDIH
ncbi:YitT family protein [Lysinibacillus irui]|uniref:YitT family protein n=1 Tax=Lysinibacillus irui TaxID=2998077 RepID=A0AAJ5RQ10_9BACI|nr:MULTISPECIES: YitT family protein [Lysinibacillus]MEA0554677.1 YitT family protein [Lysinibacillus irui]MEA0564108.1 YitT family protein [Lysinibacillus irui]MEA0978749.1 YitT family protein [Lysinibacillus irui]MEA1044903.1 YitT family protein [Lysinibacillus irui]WDV09173.1 YitT family protein [Lysinibacillus irui]